MKTSIFKMLGAAFLIILFWASAQVSATTKNLDAEIAQKQEDIENVLRALRHYQEIVNDPDTIIMENLHIFAGVPLPITKNKKDLKMNLCWLISFISWKKRGFLIERN